MFTCQMKESTERSIELHDIQFKVLRILIHNAYCRDIRLTPATVCDILIGASMLQFEAVIRRYFHISSVKITLTKTK